MPQALLFVSLVMSFALLASSCDDAAAPSVETSTNALSVVYESSAQVATQPTEAPITSVGSAGSVVLVGTEAGLLVHDEDQLESAQLIITDDDQPVTVGEIFAIAKRSHGAFVASTEGLFVWSDGMLQTSPAGASLEGLSVRAMASRDSEVGEELWLVSDHGLSVISDGTRTDFDVPMLAAPPQRVAASEDALLVASTTQLVAIALPSMEVSTFDDLGVIHQLAGAGPHLWALTDAGPVGRSSGAPWQQLDLGDGSRSRSIVVDPTLGLFIITDKGVVTGDSAVEVPWPEADASMAALDSLGRLVVANSTVTMTVVVDMAKISFAEDIAPIFETRCNTCHLAGTPGVPFRDFTDYEQVVALEDPILERMGTGLMPPVGSPELSDDEFDAVVAWFATGAQP